MHIPLGSIVKRRLHGLAGLFFWHMGVYVGAGMVIHFGGEKKPGDDTVRRDTLETFAAGRRVVLHAEPRDTAHSEAVVDAAERLCADARNRFNGRYHFAHNNCEDFCVASYEVACE